MPNTIKLKQLDRADLTAFVNDLIDGTGVVYTANRALVTDSSGDVVVSSVTSTELGYLSGVTSAIQTQLNAKQATITGGATSITSSDLTASRALASDASGKVAVSSVTATELGYVSGVTSAIQTQLNAKVGTSLTSAYIFVGNVSNIATGVAISGDISISNAGLVAISSGVIVNDDINASAAIAVSKLAAVTASRALVSDVSGFISASSVTSTELGYISGVTSAIQTQINAKFTLPSLTSGSVLFSNGTTISQDNSNLVWDNSNKRLGIGTAPSYRFHVAGTTSTMVAQYQNTTSGNSVYFQCFDANTFEHYYANSSGYYQIRASQTRIQGVESSLVVLTVKGASSQTANLQQWQNSSGTVLANVANDGVFQAAGYKSSDGSSGATGSATSANTLTIKNGLVTNIA